MSEGDVAVIREALDWYSQRQDDRLAVKPARIRGRRPEAAIDRLAAALERVERERDAANTYYEAAKEVAIDLRRERDEYKADRDEYDALLGRKMAERDEWHARAEKAERALAEIADDPRTPFTVGDIARAALRPSEEASDES